MERSAEKSLEIEIILAKSAMNAAEHVANANMSVTIAKISEVVMTVNDGHRAVEIPANRVTTVIQ